MNDWERWYFRGLLKEQPSRLERWMRRHAVPGVILASLLLGGGIGALSYLKWGSSAFAVALGITYAFIGALPWLQTIWSEKHRKKIRRALEERESDLSRR